MSESLATYLHDHLGAANFAIELLKKWTDGSQASGLRDWAQPLLMEIDQDRAELRTMIERIGQPAHSLKETAGWLAEKASRAKLSDRGNPAFAEFEGLEILALGILGKLALWEVLRNLASHDSRLADCDWPRLINSARDQHRRVEARRLQMAESAFGPSDSCSIATGDKGSGVTFKR